MERTITIELMKDYYNALVRTLKYYIKVFESDAEFESRLLDKILTTAVPHENKDTKWMTVELTKVELNKLIYALVGLCVDRRIKDNTDHFEIVRESYNSRGDE